MDDVEIINENNKNQKDKSKNSKEYIDIDKIKPVIVPNKKSSVFQNIKSEEGAFGENLNHNSLVLNVKLADDSNRIITLTFWDEEVSRIKINI